MKSNSTHYAPQGGGNQRVKPGQADTNIPIINWAALWSRLWFFCKRLVAEIWYLFSRRQASPVAAKSRQRKSTTTSLALVHWKKWSFPLFKVAAVLVLFFYVMQRDIQFSIHMKAPLGQSSAFSSNVWGTAAETMGFAQSVSFSANPAASKQEPSLNAPQVEDYLERFANLAQTEMKKFGIPASIKMAQAILESNAGQSLAARTDNNHFGAPLAGQPYESAWRNWREHSLLLMNKFPHLQDLGTDYRAWARGLQKAAYSDSPNYANQLLEIIDHFHLEQLDDPTI
jgi:flagellum-specific peptidoglycan hydrolase FlgJ